MELHPKCKSVLESKVMLFSFFFHFFYTIESYQFSIMVCMVTQLPNFANYSSHSQSNCWRWPGARHNPFAYWLITILVCYHCSLLHQKLIVLSGCNSSCCAHTCNIVGLSIHQPEPHLCSLYVCGCRHTYDHLLCTKGKLMQCIHFLYNLYNALNL